MATMAARPGSSVDSEVAWTTSNPDGRPDQAVVPGPGQQRPGEGRAAHRVAEAGERIGRADDRPLGRLASSSSSGLSSGGSESRPWSSPRT